MSEALRTVHNRQGGVKLVGQGAGPPWTPTARGQVGLYALIGQGGVDHGFPFCV